MSIRRHDLGATPLELVACPGVYTCRCPACGRDFLATDASPYLARIGVHHRVVACPDCYTTDAVELLRARMALVTAMQPSDPFEGFPTEGAA